AVKFLDSLSQNSYYLTELKKVINGDSKTEIYFDKGINFNEAVVKITDDIAKTSGLKSEFYTKNLDSLKNKISNDYRNKGFAFNRVKSKFLGMKNNIPHIEITVVEGDQRKVNRFVLKGYEKVPKR